MRLESPNKFPEDNFRPNLLEDHYITIDDDAFAKDDLGMVLLIHKHSNETRRNSKHTHYEYAYSIGICHVKTAFTHVADDTSMTPSSDCASPVEIFQNDGNEVPDTDHAYLTVLDDSSHSLTG
ncbi:hypothetical protein ACJMK2_026188 [Sinanodonta woodiana]|uniref:Uncharacterized protein n=1 Tax=Sinanodonta woodiana TaxID=1069815 RepID=A0ABD3XIT6_SINWO